MYFFIFLKIGTSTPAFGAGVWGPQSGAVDKIALYRAGPRYKKVGELTPDLHDHIFMMVINRIIKSLV